jgi:hypothetical protein
LRKKNTLIICSLVLFLLVLTGCADSVIGQISNDPPVCVTLDAYSSVIDQQMHASPVWNVVSQSEGFSLVQWSLQNTTGSHSLSATLTSDGCICGTRAQSQFRFGKGDEILVGLLEGAAVVPISDLNFTEKWLNPKIKFQCTLANIFHRSYSAESAMKDGTTWKLTCSRLPGDASTASTYTFSVTTPDCLASK